MDNKKETGIAAGLFVIIFSIYRITLAPAIGFIDSGELAAVASTLGIAHPTGYPLFTLCGRIFSMIPLAGELIVRLNVMSAVFTASASVVFFFFILELLESNRSDRRVIHYGSAFFATGAISFSQTFWRQAVSVEVYSLHLLLMCLTLLLLLKAVHTDRPSMWFLFAFVLGLSFTNHLTTILLVPAVLYLFFAEHGFTRSAFQRIGRLAVSFGIGLSVYLFLPIRAASHPLLNWGNPQTFEKFLWHVSGKQFRVWMFSSADSARKQLNYFFERAPLEFYYIPLVIAIVGLFVVLFNDRRKFVFLSLLIVTCIAYSINYDIHDIDSYFLLAYASLMVFSAYGIRFIFKSVEIGRNAIVVIIAVVVLLGFQIAGNWKAVDQSKNYLVEDYAKSVLSSLPKNSIIISYQWDYFVSPSYYFQHVQKFRPDIVVLDKELFRRSWYFSQLEHLYPAIVQKSRNEIDAFQKELYKFEHDLPYDFAVIEGKYGDLLNSFIVKNIDSIPIFVTNEIEQQYTNGYSRIPNGLVYQLTRDRSYISTQFPNLPRRSNITADKYINQLNGIISTSLYQRGLFEQFYRNDSLTDLYFSASKNVLK